MTPMPDLIERFKAGDPDAVRAIYREHAGAVHTVARSIVRDRELAAEVVQQTFVKAWRAARRFEGSREIAPWLYSIARHTAIDALRAETKPTRGGHEPETDFGVETETFEQTWERFEVRRAIDALPANERDVVRLSHLEGYTHEQIAVRLDIPVGTVKSRSGRAHKRLVAALAHLAANQIDSSDVQGGEHRP
jgi:RNA polymerase sigma-70 factor (ECF subfamily)